MIYESVSLYSVCAVQAVWPCDICAKKGTLLMYATLDAYATFVVHLQLAGMAVAPPVTASTPAGTSVVLISPDGNQVACGIIAIEQPPMLNGVILTSSQSVMTVSQVLVPGFLIPASLCGTGIKHSQPLSSHGNPPFSLSANNSSLRICVGNLNADNGLGNMHNPDSAGPPLPVLSVATVDTQQESAVTSDPELPDSERMPETSQSLVLPFDDLSDEEDSKSDERDYPEQSLEGSAQDQAAEVAFQTLIKPCLNNQNGLQQIHSIWSHVVYDNFHSYHHIPISCPHGLQCPFCRALSAAFFLPVAEDKAAVEVVLKKYCTSYNSQLHHENHRIAV